MSSPFVQMEAIHARPDDAPLLLTVRAAAHLLSVSKDEVYRMVASGELPHVRIGEKSTGIRIARQDIEGLIRRYKVHGR